MKKWNKERRVMLPSFLISKSKSFLTFVCMHLLMVSGPLCPKDYRFDKGLHVQKVAQQDYTHLILFKLLIAFL